MVAVESRRRSNWRYVADLVRISGGWMREGQIVGDLLHFSTFLAHFDFQEARNQRGEVNRAKENEERTN